MIKYIIILSFALLAPCAKGETDWKAINELVENKRKIIIEKYEECHSLKKIRDDVYIRHIKGGKPITSTDALLGILRKVRDVGCCDSKYCSVFRDEKMFTVLLEILNKVNDSRVLNSMITDVFELRNHKFIINNSELIKSVIAKVPLTSKTAVLLSLCEISSSDIEKIHNTLSTTGKIPLFVQVRMGNESAESELIKMYEEENQFDKLIELSTQLELAGTDKCELALVKSLETKGQVKLSKRYGFSIRYYIIQALGRLHSEVHLLNDLLLDVRYEISDEMSFGEKKPSEIVTPYYLKVYHWVHETYGLKLEQLRKSDFLFSYTVTTTKDREFMLNK